MSPTVASTQVPAVRRLPKTSDLGSVGDRYLAVAGLADLTHNATEVTFCTRTDLGPCEDCGKIHSVAVATVSWPDPLERDERGEITVCRDCLGRQVDHLASTLDLAAEILVEVPTWNLGDLIREVGDSVVWALPLLVRDDSPGRCGYLADEVAHAERLLDLQRAGISLPAADKLLRRDPAVVDAVETILWSAA